MTDDSQILDEDAPPPFSRPVSEEALRLHRDAIVIDCLAFDLFGHSRLLEQSGITALSLTVPEVEDEAGAALRRIAAAYETWRADPRLVLAETTQDIRDAHRDGKLAAIVNAQDGRHLGHPGLVEAFHRLGQRISQLAYNDRSFAADGCDTGDDAGLTKEGRKAIDEMNRVGMVLDLSHCGLRSSLEAAEHTAATPIISHANPRAVGPDVPRNVTDEQIRAVADRGGVIGLTQLASLNWRGTPGKPTLEQYLESVEYVVELVGIDHVGFGTDSPATPGMIPRGKVRHYMRRYPGNTGGYHDTLTEDELLAVPGLDGCRGHSDLPVVTQTLLDRGWTPEDVRKYLGENFLRVFDEVWPA